jgi:hypothetical protein
VETGLLRDSDWAPLDGEVCRVIEFTPLAGRMEGGKVKSFTRRFPYASIEIESPALAEPTTGFIKHKIDFQHLWEAFNVRGVGDDEEVIVSWNKSYVKERVGKLVSTMPGLVVWVCPRNAYEVMTDANFRPELDGMARHKAAAPIVEWRPEIME